MSSKDSRFSLTLPSFISSSFSASTVLSSLLPSVTPLPSSSTGTITLCLSLLRKSDPPVFSLHVSVEQGLLGLQTAGQRHEDGVHVLTLPGVFGRRLEQQHVVGVGKFERRVGGNLGNRRCLVVRLKHSKRTQYYCVLWLGLEYTHLYLVDQITLVSHQDSRNGCWHPVAVTLLEHNGVKWNNKPNKHRQVICDRIWAAEW